jgi:hypothetical protein
MPIVEVPTSPLPQVDEAAPLRGRFAVQAANVRSPSSSRPPADGPKTDTVVARTAFGSVWAGDFRGTELWRVTP